MWGFLLRILTSVILTGISAYLSYRKPERVNPGTLDDLGNPRAEEGEEIIKVFGTVTIADPQVVWFGDLTTRPITQSAGRKYGLFGPKQKTTIGFRYSLGLHFVLCLGPVDYVRRIRIDKRLAWSGESTGGAIAVDQPYLFGRLSRERGTGNGVGGAIDVLMGKPDQAPNAYLAAVAGGPAPAYRGVTSLVARSFYIGNAPSLRPWEVRVTRITAVDEGYSDGFQWYPEKATLSRPGGTFAETVDFDLATAFPTYEIGDPEWPGEGGDHPNTLTIGPFPENRQIVAGPLGATADDRFVFNGVLYGTVNFVTYPAGTVFYDLPAGQTLTVGVRDIEDFFIGASGSLEAVATTTQDADMNPVHILREVLLSPDSGGTGIEAEAGTTWEVAADTIFDEGFGISIAWRGATDRVEFKKEIERHIDARSYIDRRTGLWEIKLIRDDYDVDELPIFDKSNVASWSEIRFPEPTSLINQLVVTWRDLDKDEDTSLTISNPARIRMAGSQVFQEKVAYPGITRAELASRVAMRDLSARSAPLVTGEFRAKNFPTDLNIGSPIIVNNPRLGLVNRVVRVTEIDDGNARDSSTTVRFVEDRFALGEEADLEFEVIEPTTDEALPVEPRMVEEAPLQVLREQLGQPNVDAVLLEDDQAGFLFIAGGRPTSTSRDAIALRDLGAGYEDLDSVEFSVSATLLGAMTRRADHEKVVVESSDDLAALTVGARVWVDGEQMLLELVEEGDTSDPGDYWEPTETATNAVFTLTLTRGALDTAPSNHAAGAGAIFYEEFGYLEDDIQTDGDEADVKLLTATNQQVLALGDAPVDTVTFSSRALRPYPPGDLKLDGDYEVLPLPETSAYVLTWVHRDRLEGTIIGHAEAGPGSPEVGVTYLVRVEAIDDQGDVVSVLTSVDVGTSLTYTWTPVIPPSGAVSGRMSVASVRGGLESWTRPSIGIRLEVGTRAFEDEVEERPIEDNDIDFRVIED